MQTTSVRTYNTVLHTVISLSVSSNTSDAVATSKRACRSFGQMGMSSPTCDGRVHEGRNLTVLYCVRTSKNRQVGEAEEESAGPVLVPDEGDSSHVFRQRQTERDGLGAWRRFSTAFVEIPSVE